MITYLIHLTMGWALFACLYRLWLEKETFFGLNRGFLLLALGASFVLPLAGVYFKPVAGGSSTVLHPAWLPNFTVGVERATATFSGSGIFQNLLYAVWLLGALIGFFRLLSGLRAIMVIARHVSEKQGNVYYSTAIDLPFSFLKWVFIPEVYRNAPNLEGVLAHEQAHAKGWHSLDILCSELVCILFWWHPLAHWHHDALRRVHEFIADKAAAQQISRQQYGLLLISCAQSGPVLAYANHFFQSPLKQRLIMLTKNASAPVRSIKYALVVPVMALLFTFFQSNTAAAQQTTAANLVEDPEHAPEYPGGNDAFFKFLSDNIKYPESARKAKTAGTVILSFVVNEQGNVADITSKVDVSKELEAEAIRVIGLTKWTPATDKGKTVKANLCIPVKFKLQ